MSRLSVIVPVYNVEKLLIPCLDSIMQQLVDELELICVNDGSTDHSLDVLKDYRTQHQSDAGRNIVILDQKNGGPSKARNTGLEHATGDYIGFVDSDDYVEPEMYRELLAIAECKNLDVVLCGILNCYPDGRNLPAEKKAPTDCLLGRKEILEYICPTLMREDVFGGPCNRIYRRAFLNENHIRMPENLGYGEDAVFQMQVFDALETTWIDSRTFYHYLHREGSQSSAKPCRFFNTLEPLYKIRCQYGRKWSIPDSDIANYFVCCSIMDMIATVYSKNVEGKKTYLKTLYHNNSLRKALNASTIKKEMYTRNIYAVYRVLKWIL